MDDLVKRCVDLDQWQHSWYNDFKELEDYEKARDVIKEKIESRTDAYILDLNSGGLVHPEMLEDYCKAAFTKSITSALKFKDRKEAADAALSLGIERYTILFATEEYELVTDS